MYGLLLTRLTVAAHELVYATSCVNELRLTSVEGVRSRRDFQLNNGVSFAFEFYSVVSLASRTREEHVTVRHILEYYGTIIFRVKTFFHFLIG
jgi:hypothetical protein